MDDRELLERAAKAAGADWVVEEDGRFEVLSEIGGVSGYWNPLTDDGDALRLAVKLGLELDFDDGSTTANDRHLLVYAHEFHAGQAMERTRRAIVRAAAAMAKED